MNFFSIIIWSYFVLAAYLSFIIGRDQRQPGTFCHRHRRIALGVILIMVVGALLAFDTHYIEPWTIRVKETVVPLPSLERAVKIAWLADLQVGNHKQKEWLQKVVAETNNAHPDLIIIGGDVIDNEGSLTDETSYLEPLRLLAEKYPTFYIIGNHEYGIGNLTRGRPERQTGDRSAEVIARMNSLGIVVLRDKISCPLVKEQKICLFGADDLWGNPTPNFTELALWYEEPLIFLSHNPDGITRWPTSLPLPDLTLAGHSHGGQIYLPIIGPLGKAGIELGSRYYRGLNQYRDRPIYTSVGLGESGGAIRFFTLPEISLIKLVPAAQK